MSMKQAKMHNVVLPILRVTYIVAFLVFFPLFSASPIRDTPALPSRIIASWCRITPSSSSNGFSRPEIVALVTIESFPPFFPNPTIP
jgi:hypothetical protein